MVKKLNYPLIITQIFDNTMIHSYVALNVFFLANEQFTPLSSVISYNIFFFMIVFHDHLYYLIFPNLIAKVKRDYKVTWTDVYYYIKFVPGIYSLTFYYMIQWKILLDFEYKTLNSFIIRIFIEYVIMYLGKDFTTMKFLHPIMHTQKWYWTHDVHHKIGASIQIANCFHFDTHDIFLESLVAPLFAITFNYAVYGTLTIHFISFIYLVWSGTLTH